jgi:Protein of unknown function (DUF3099)
MSEDIRYRQRRYLIMMGVRVVGLVLAVFLFHGVARFIAAAVAIVMPYFAVVFANGGREPDSGNRFKPYDPHWRELPSQSSAQWEARAPGNGTAHPGATHPGATPEPDGSAQPDGAPPDGTEPDGTQPDDTAQAGRTARTAEPDGTGTWDERDERDGPPGREDFLPSGDGSLSAGEAADPGSERPTRSNTA